MEKIYLGELPESKIRISDIIIALSTSLDLKKRKILSHSLRVAYISLKLAQKIKISQKRINKIVLAALLHDIGFVNTNLNLESKNIFSLPLDIIKNHCQLGSNLIENVKCFPEISDIIYTHHNKWSGNNFNNINGKNIPLGGRIIHIADRLEVSIDKNKYILSQKNEILKKFKFYSASLFDPNLIDILIDLGEKEYFWLDLETGKSIDILEHWGKTTNKVVSINDLEQIASVFAEIIDMKSPFTSSHSAGVATIASMISHEIGYSKKEQQVLRISGLLHDLGKQIIPSSILEKKGKLTNYEIEVIAQHSYYTYYLLDQVRGLGSIPNWAAYHHERLDGSGYPFHLNAKNLSQGSRIIAISDMFQALTEERPYRKALSIEEALNILKELGNKNKLDINIINFLKSIML
ncbi:MAG: HD-GYP domain-containing protein [Nanoarchaeota archaeon]